VKPLIDKRLYPALGAGFLHFRATFEWLQMLKIAQVLRKEDAATQVAAPDGIGAHDL
jgi:hypothetical protein